MIRASLVLLSLSVLVPSLASSAEGLIPAGSLVQCTISEPRLSSKTLAVGDPVLCKISSAERYGRSVLPYDSFMVGRFEDFRDPGHLVGKGWLELKFERMVIEPDTILPVESKVVAVPGYPIDRDGRIHGKGHPVRDIAEWTIPILWPIDVLNLPRRGPRPTLKGETRLTLKIMDDLRVPETEVLPRDPSGLIRRAPSAYDAPRPRRTPPQTNLVAKTEPLVLPPSLTDYEAVSDSTAAQRRESYLSSDRTERLDPLTLVYNDGRPRERIYNYVLTPDTVYVLDRGRREVPVDDLDVAATRQVNRDAGVNFTLPDRSQYSRIRVDQP